MKYPPRTPLENKLAHALQKQTVVWRPECPQPEVWYDWIRQGDKFASAEHLAKHLFTCGFCRREYDIVQAILTSAEKGMSSSEPSAICSLSARLRDGIMKYFIARPLPIAFAAACLLVLFLGLETFSGLQFASQQRDDPRRPVEREPVLFDAKKQDKTAALQKKEARWQVHLSDLMRKNKANAAGFRQTQKGFAALSGKYFSETAETQRIVLNDGDARIVEDSAGHYKRNKMPLSLEAGQTIKTSARSLRLAANVRDMFSKIGNEVCATRGGDDTEQLITPEAQVIEEDKPTFEWKQFEGANKYILRIEDEEGNQSKYYTVEAPATQFTLLLPLERGKIYSWSVAAENAQEERIGLDSQEDDFKAPVRKSFAILDDFAYSKLRQNQNSPLILGILYAQSGLFDRAIIAFQTLKRSNPDSSLPDQLIQQTQALREEANRGKKSEIP